MWSVDNIENLSQVESLSWVWLKHAGDGLDELRTVSELSHEVELLVELWHVQLHVLVVIEVSDRIVACSAERGDSQGEYFVSLVVDVLHVVVWHGAHQSRSLHQVAVGVDLVRADLHHWVVVLRWRSLSWRKVRNCIELRIDSRIQSLEDQIISESLKLLWRQGSVIVLFLEDSVGSSEVLVQKRHFKQFDLRLLGVSPAHLA